MNKRMKKKPLRGWDDEKIYFLDERTNQEYCVTDETELYEQLVKICKEYYENISSKGD